MHGGTVKITDLYISLPVVQPVNSLKP